MPIPDIGTSMIGTAKSSAKNSATGAAPLERPYTYTTAAAAEKIKKLLNRNAEIVTRNQQFLQTTNSVRATADAEIRWLKYNAGTANAKT